MPLFLSSFENRLDTKGRISVPAPFRLALTGELFNGVVLYRSFTNDCIDGVAISRMERLAAAADGQNIFDNEIDDLTAMLFADARLCPIDTTGRIVVPADLLKHANIKNTALFIGRGNSFQIWEPQAFKAAQEKSLNNLRAKKPNIKL